MMSSSETCNAYQTISTLQRSFVGHCEAALFDSRRMPGAVLSFGKEKATIR
jgi:hypothetical protein